LLKSRRVTPKKAVVDQVSLPMRVALAAVLSFAALWFVALRPKPVEEVAPDPVPAAPQSTRVTDRPAQAKKAVEKLNGTSAKREAAQVEQAKPEPAKAEPAKPAPAKAEAKAPAAKERVAKPVATKPAKPKVAKGAAAVVADVKAGRTVVLLFWDGKSAEDQAVRRAVAKVDRHDGKVRVHVAQLRQISRYGAITQGVPVTSSPTVLVIGKGGKAEVIRGLTVTGEIDDTVSGILRRKS
jgi:hypothetical protein